MKKFRHFLLLISLMVLSAKSFGGFQGLATIEGYDVGNTGKLIIRLNQVNVCGSNIVQVSSSEPYYKDILSTTEAAYFAGKQVNVWVDTCSGTLGNILRMITGTVW